MSSRERVEAMFECVSVFENAVVLLPRQVANFDGPRDRLRKEYTRPRSRSTIILAFSNIMNIWSLSAHIFYLPFPFFSRFNFQFFFLKIKIDFTTEI